VTERYDVVVIGTGAGGGTMLHALAPTGKRILVLERGDFLPRERENWDPIEVNRNARYLADESWLDKDGNAFRPYIHYWVGGNTKVYGAALLRLREWDFQEIKHWGGVSPAWPIDYAELEPWYARAEELYHVHGEAGLDPTGPPRSGPYPYPAVEFEPRMREIYDALRAQGLRPFPCALGVRLGDERGAPPHPRRVLGLFDGYPDPTETKADAEVVCVNPALRHPNVTLLVNARAERLETDASGRRVTRVVAVREGRREEYAADLVVVACGAINSAALLLRSASDRHPAGLANGSGLVGRHYMCHNNGMVIAVSDTPNPSRFQKAFAMTDFYREADDSPFPLGTIQLMGKPDPDLLASEAGPHLPGVPLGELWSHTVDFFLTAEDLPLPENRVSVERDGRLRLSYTENNREAYDRLRAKLVATFDSIGCCPRRHVHTPAYVGPKLGIGGVSHQCGTLRFGSDPRASVLDVHCRAHELENLYVTDASFFPSAGAVNPTLTIVANALRVGDHLARRLGAGAA
jgi:choline dehydrogenase-like flavoprotein